MEGPHGKLRAGLADRLRGDDSDCLSHLDHPASWSPAGKHRLFLAPVDPRLFYLIYLGLVYFVVGLDQHFLGEGVQDLFEDDPSQYSLSDGLDDLSALYERGHVDAVERAAVVFRDDGVLRDIDEPPGEITGGRGLKRGVGKTLPGSVSRYEVLEHGEAFPEVRGNGRLDDLA